MQYMTASGQKFTDEDIKKWSKCYDNGEFLPNSETTSVISGKPAHEKPQTATITLKVPIGMKEALKNRAKQEGMTTSAYIRNALVSASL